MIIKKYIECEKLIKALKIWQNKIIETYGKNDEYVKCLDAVLLGVDHTPAADVRPVVKAEWYGEADGYADGELVYDMWSCPICGKRFEEWEEKPDWNYCPNCGADMREES